MIGVIADDLTGAAEIGAVGWRHGLRAAVVVSGKPDRRVDLVCIDTDSRSCAPEEAGRRATDAAATLRRAGAKWIYKKVDSVLRGPVTAEVEAIMTELGMTRALLAPANPSLGRVIRNETYFVHGQPVHETEFAQDPEHPRKSARVLDLLAAPRSFSVSVSRPNVTKLAAGIVIGEAASTEDLRLWAAHRAADTLLVGGAEFFSALLAAAGHSIGKNEGNDDAPTGPELFLCGSTSEASREFVRVERQRGTPVFSLPEGLAGGAEFTAHAAEAIAHGAMVALRSHARVILNVGLPFVRGRSVASRLVLHLVQVAGAVLRQADVAHVYAEGGATAAALLRRMDWKRLEVVHELAPGVATLAAERNQSMWLTIKPGSYVWPAGLRDHFNTRGGHELAGSAKDEQTMPASPRDNLIFVDPSSIARRLLWHVFSIGSRRITSTDQHEPFEKPGAHLFWVQSGEGELEHETGRFALRRGRKVWLVDMSRPRTYIPSTKRHLTIAGFRFGGPGLEFWHEEIGGGKSSEFTLDDFGFVKQTYAELLRLIRRRPTGWEWQIHVVITNMLGKLLMSRNLLVSPHAELPAAVVRVLNAISANPLRDWKARELALVGKVSYSGLRALFKKSGQGTLHQHIQRVRLDQARLLLADERLSVKDVAAQLSFSNEFYFSYFFRHETGMSPTEFRQHLKA